VLGLPGQQPANSAALGEAEATENFDYYAFYIYLYYDGAVQEER